MAQVSRSDRAQDDLEGIFDFLESQSSAVADRFAAKFEQTCELHSNHPQIGQGSADYAPNLRHFTVWNFAIFYREVEDGIELIRVLHGARDIPRLFEWNRQEENERDR